MHDVFQAHMLAPNWWRTGIFALNPALANT